MLEWLTQPRVINVCTRLRIGTLQLYNDNKMFEGAPEYEKQTVSLCLSYLSHPYELDKFVNSVIEHLKTKQPETNIAINREFVETAYGRELTDEEFTILSNSAVELNGSKFDGDNELTPEDLEFLISVDDIVAFYSSQHVQIVRYIICESENKKELHDALIAIDRRFDFDDIREFCSVAFDNSFVYQLPENELHNLIDLAFAMMARSHYAEVNGKSASEMISSIKPPIYSEDSEDESLREALEILDDIPAKYYCDYLDRDKDKDKDDKEEEDE